MMCAEHRQIDIKAEAHRFENFESLISQFQEILSVRDCAIRCTGERVREEIDGTFNPALDTILKILAEDINRFGPFTSQVLLQHTNSEENIAA